MGAVLGIISLASLGIVIFLSARQNGEVPAGYGVTGLLATVFSMIGIGLSVFGVREKNCFRFFPWLGVVVNTIVLVMMGILLYAGI